jgi:hypothetical protein
VLDCLHGIASELNVARPQHCSLCLDWLLIIGRLLFSPISVYFSAQLLGSLLKLNNSSLHAGNLFVLMDFEQYVMEHAFDRSVENVLDLPLLLALELCRVWKTHSFITIGLGKVVDIIRLSLLGRRHLVRIYVIGAVSQGLFILQELLP